MKKSTATLEHIHDEPAEAYTSKAHLPRLSYRQAMRSYFVIQGAVHMVETCPAWAIQELVNAAILTAKNPETCVTSLAGLDYRESVDRFYALNELLRLRAAVPLYSTLAEAETALQATFARELTVQSVLKGV